MKIAVIYGGLSSERDVSISSGLKVAHALRLKGHEVADFDLYTGVLCSSDEIPNLFSSSPKENSYSVSYSAPDIEKIKNSDCFQGFIGPNVIEICKAADIVFLALHGGCGENGQLQACFDLHGIRYTGADYLGSAIAMNKSVSKTLMQAAGVPVPSGITLHHSDDIYDIGFPCVVKPCSGGSSIGTTIVTSEQQYLVALEEAFKFEDSVLVEQYIKGRELTVGVIDGNAMPVVEIIPKTGFYDYKNKYQPGFTEEICPAPITSQETILVQELAETVIKALHIKSYGRVDFIMTEGGKMYCLEANTLPGMTPTSLIPQMAAASGLDYASLCEKIIEVSLKKYYEEPDC